MTPSHDLIVRPLEPNDHLFLAWTIRRRARADRQLPPLAPDDNVEALAERTTALLERNARSGAWLVLVAEWRRERVGFAVRAPSTTGGISDRYVDPWYAGLGIERALQEAVDLGWAAQAPQSRGSPRAIGGHGPTAPHPTERRGPFDGPRVPARTTSVPSSGPGTGGFTAGAFRP